MNTRGKGGTTYPHIVSAVLTSFFEEISKEKITGNELEKKCEIQGMFIASLSVSDFCSLCSTHLWCGRWNVNTVHLDTAENNLNIGIIFIPNWQMLPKAQMLND